MYFSRKVAILLCLAGALVILLVLGLPLVGVGNVYNFYADNKLCAFNLAPEGHPVQRILIGYCGVQGIAWVMITVMCNMAVSRKLNHKKLHPSPALL